MKCYGNPDGLLVHALAEVQAPVMFLRPFRRTLDEEAR
jgi:hypothetical protein